MRRDGCRPRALEHRDNVTVVAGLVGARLPPPAVDEDAAATLTTLRAYTVGDADHSADLEGAGNAAYDD